MTEKKVIELVIKDITRRSLLSSVKEIVKIDIWELLDVLDKHIEGFR